MASKTDNEDSTSPLEIIVSAFTCLEGGNILSLITHIIGHKILNSERAIHFRNQYIKQDLLSIILEPEHQIHQLLGYVLACNEREERKAKRVLIGEIQRQITFQNQVVVSETQKIILAESGMHSRENTVLRHGNVKTYCEYLDVLKQIMARLGIHDGVIATIIRSILLGQKIDLELEPGELDQITDFTFRLFGPEAARNPGSIVHHQMMLDLLIANFESDRPTKVKLTEPYGTWERFLTGVDGQTPDMPMASSESTAKARGLHRMYYNVVGYKYSGEESIGKDLATEEMRISETWFQEFGHSQKPLNEKFLAIMKACERWYPI